MTGSTEEVQMPDVSGALQTASKVSLQGGGVLFAAVVLAVFNVHYNKWVIDLSLIVTALIGAILLGLASTAARIYDARLRTKLALKWMEIEANQPPSPNPPSLDDLITAVQKILDHQVMRLDTVMAIRGTPLLPESADGEKPGSRTKSGKQK